MAKLQGLSIDIGVTIPEETVQRCVAILNMYLTDNPDMEVEIHEDRFDEENPKRFLVFSRKEKKID